MKITSNIITEIHISHLYKTEQSNLLHMEAISTHPQLFWIKGILFSLCEFDSEKLTIELTKGIFYLDTFNYSICKEKPEQLKHNGFQIDVFDLSNHPTYTPIIDYVLEKEK